MGAGPGRELDRVLGRREVGAVAALRGQHVVVPDRSGIRSPERTRSHRGPGVRVTDPDRGREPRRVAREPGVRVVVGGSRLAGLARATDARRRPGAGGDHALEHVGHLVGNPVGESAGALLLLGDVRVAVGELDLADRGSRVADAAVGKRRVGVRHLQRRDPDPQAADAFGREPVEVGGDAHVVGRVADLLGPHVQIELGVDGVHRTHGGVAHAHRPAASLSVVDGPVGDPVVQRQGDRGLARVVGRIGVHALANGGGQHEGLERRPRLTVGIGGEVELGGRGVGLRRGHGDDVAVGGVDRDQRPRRPAVVVVGDRLLGGGLELGVDRRMDLEAAVSHRVHPVLVDQLLGDVVEEVGLADGLVLAAAVEPQPRLERLLVVLLGDVSLPRHRLEHVVAPLHRPLRVQERVVLGGRLRQPGDQRRLGQVELLDRL